MLETAQLDLGLNFLLFELWPYISWHGIDKEPAFKLGNKINQIETTIEAAQDTSPIAGELTTVVAEIKAINDVRTAVVHGALTGWRLHPEHALISTKVDYSKPLNSYQGARSFITREVLINSAYQCTLATSRFHALTDVFKKFRSPFRGTLLIEPVQFLQMLGEQAERPRLSV